MKIYNDKDNFTPRRLVDSTNALKQLLEKHRAKLHESDNLHRKSIKQAWKDSGGL